MSRVHESFERLRDNAGMAVWWQEYCDGEESPFVAQYHVQGNDGGTWQIAISSQQPTCTVTEGSTEDPDLTLMFSEGDWLDVVAGRSSVWSLLASGRVVAEGDETRIGDLDLLGLLGPPVTPTEVSDCSQQRWLFRRPWLGSSDALWVVPRVLTAGRIDHDKWIYFSRRGDLWIEIPPDIPWRTLSEPAAAHYADTLRTVLRPLDSRHFFLRLPVTPVAWVPAAVSVMLLGFAAVGATLWLFLLLLLVGVLWLAAAALRVSALLDPFGPTYKRARDVLTGFARQDAHFFELAIDSALIQIGQPRGMK